MTKASWGKRQKDRAREQEESHQRAARKTEISSERTERVRSSGLKP